MIRFDCTKIEFFQKKKEIFLSVSEKAVFLHRIWDGSSVGLERMLDRHEVTSSILVRPTRNADGVFLFNRGTLAQLV